MIKDLFAHIKRKKEKIQAEELVIELMEERIIKLANKELIWNRTLLEEHLNTPENIEKYINSSFSSFKTDDNKIKDIHVADVFGIDRVQIRKMISFKVRTQQFYLEIPMRVDKIWRIEGCEDTLTHVTYGEMYKGTCCNKLKSEKLQDALFDIIRMAK